MNIKTSSRRFFSILRTSAIAFRERRKWDSVIVHNGRFTQIPPTIAMPLLCGHIKDAVQCPDNLTIVLIHNYKNTPLMEESLRYAGIDNYVVLKPDYEGEWRDSIKFTTMYHYLQSGACQTEFLLHVDARDAFLRADPQKAITYLQELNCDCLFSVESASYGYECTPEVKAWANQNTVAHGYQALYINSGVYIGRTKFLEKLLQETMRYITPTDFSRAEFRKHLFAGTLCNALPDYPKGVGSDQQIVRWLHPHFYPRMQCDYEGRLTVPR
ncbi:MAG: hypothetical protein GY943_22120 [Chloroflexi bacterium]|nr:hypothetical protein [Chloroflexota bacterium]